MTDADLMCNGRRNLLNRDMSIDPREPANSRPGGFFSLQTIKARPMTVWPRSPRGLLFENLSRLFCVAAGVDQELLGRSTSILRRSGARKKPPFTARLLSISARKETPSAS